MTDTAPQETILPPQFAQAPSVVPVPEVIGEAIRLVMSEIKPISKSEENTFGKYKYASVDAFYEMIQPLLAKHKLNILPIEVQPVRIERFGDKPWGHFVIGFVLSVGGVTYYEPLMTETLFIKIEGPQTFNGAKSYAQKTFLRQLFKVPTGEMDLDGTDQDRDEDAAKKPKKKTPEKAELLSPGDSSQRLKEVLKHLGSLSKPLSKEAQSDFAERFGYDISRMMDSDKTAARDAFKKALSA